MPRNLPPARHFSGSRGYAAEAPTTLAKFRQTLAFFCLGELADLRNLIAQSAKAEVRHN